MSTVSLVLAAVPVLAAPGVIGEYVIRTRSPDRPWIGIVVGGTLALVLVLATGMALTFCGMADTRSRSCDRKIELAPVLAAIGGVTVAVVSGVAVRYPLRTFIRRVVWATPTLMVVAVVLAARVAS